MDLDPFWIIAIFIFVVGPLLERVLKGSKQQQRKPPPGQRPMPRQQPRVESGTPAEQARARMETESGDSSAAEMLPEDFWRILTGDAPRTPGPVAAPPKREERERFEVKPMPTGQPPLGTSRERFEVQSMPAGQPPLEPARARRSAPGRDVLPDEAAIAAERIRKRREATALRYAPRVAESLETEIQAEPIRHQKFHQRLDHLPPAARTRRRAMPVVAGALRGRAALRQAVLLQEVLGAPKAFEDEG